MLAFAAIEEHVRGLHPHCGSTQTLHGSERSLQRPPAFLLGHLPAEVSPQIMAGFETGPVQCHRLTDAVVSIDGITMHEGTVLTSDVLNFPLGHLQQMMNVLPCPVEAMPRREVSGPAVLMMGPGPRIFGHWLVDFLPRLFVLAEAGLDLAALRYVVPDQCDFVEPLTRMFGIDARQLIRFNDRTELLEIEELIMPSNLRRGGRFHRTMTEARRFLATRANAFGGRMARGDGGERLYVARRNGGQERTLLNRAAVEKMAADRGYRVIVPETLPLTEQFAAFSGARCIAGEYGSGLHGSLFAPPGAAVFAVRSNAHHPGFIQSGLGDACGHPTGYVLGEAPLHAVDQAFVVEESWVNAGFEVLELLTTA